MKRAARIVPPWKVETRPQGPHSNRPYNPFYHREKWTRLSVAYRKENPLCVLCQDKGIITPAQVADHIKPIHQGGDPWSRENLQALCTSCHNKKSATERT